MNRLSTRLRWVSLACVVVCAAALTSATVVTSTPAQGDPPSGTDPATGQSGLDPIKVQWNQMVEAEQAKAASVMADPAQRAAVLAAKEAQNKAAQAENGKAHQQQDIRDQCVVDAPVGAPPIPSLQFSSTGSQTRVIHGECVIVYAGQPGIDDSVDGAVFVTYRTVDLDITSRTWTFPGMGPLTLTKLTDGGIATLAPVNGKPFTLDITK